MSLSIIKYPFGSSGGGTVTSVSGTTNRITSTGGVTPIIDIAATYIGQSSITTLGTITTGIWQGTSIADSFISSASIWNAKESALTFSTGLTRTVNTITSNLSIGKAGSQSVIGGTASGETLTLSSTSNATKGSILFGTSIYDEVNNRLGIGITPLFPLHIEGATAAAPSLGLVNTDALGTTSGANLSLYAKLLPTAANQRLGIIGFGTRDGANVDNITAAIQAFSNTAFTSGSTEQTYLTFSTSATNALVEVMRITANSRVSFGAGANPTASVHIKAGFASAGGAPLKLTSGTLLTTAEAGAIEFLTDSYYATITTGAARKEITLNDVTLTSGNLPIATTNGRLTNLANGANGTYLRVVAGVPAFDVPYKGGQSVFTADGVATVFNITHNLGATPAYWTLSTSEPIPNNLLNRTITFPDANTMRITYGVAPNIGENANYVWIVYK